MSGEQTVIAMGVHVVDVLARPVEAIPEGQGGELVEDIRITPAGSAGGTAVTLAKLGARVRSAGAIGTDSLGDVLLELLGRYGIDTSLLVRREGVQTSASVLPIRPDGARPALHVVGANATYSSVDALAGTDERAPANGSAATPPGGSCPGTARAGAGGAS
jgi:sugar/nucleoside kinase (ribokinase family)